MNTKLKLKISVMSSMSAVAWKQKTTTKKLPKRPRKKTIISEISLLLVRMKMKDRTRILASALPLVCQILDAVLLIFTETTQLLLKFLVLKDSYPRFLRWILLGKWKWIQWFNLSLNLISLKVSVNLRRLKDKEKNNLTKTRKKEEVRLFNRTSKIKNESNINVDQTLLTIVKYMTEIPSNLKLLVLSKRIRLVRDAYIEIFAS
jgi:hypothetical protein